MLHYQIERTADQLSVVINRRTSAVSKVYAGIIAVFLYLGYAIWTRPDMGNWVRDFLILVCLPIGIFSILLRRNMFLEVWVFDRRTGRIRRNDTTVASIGGLQRLVVKRVPLSEQDQYEILLIPRDGKPLCVDSVADGSLLRATSLEAEALKDAAEKIAEFLEVPVTREPA